MFRYTKVLIVLLLSNVLLAGCGNFKSTDVNNPEPTTTPSPNPPSPSPSPVETPQPESPPQASNPSDEEIANLAEQFVSDNATEAESPVHIPPGETCPTDEEGEVDCSKFVDDDAKPVVEEGGPHLVDDGYRKCDHMDCVELPFQCGDDEDGGDCGNRVRNQYCDQNFPAHIVDMVEDGMNTMQLSDEDYNRFLKEVKRGEHRLTGTYGVIKCIPHGKYKLNKEKWRYERR